MLTSLDGGDHARGVTGSEGWGLPDAYVEDACKALDGLVRLRSDRSDLSGTSLMHTVFSSNNPLLRFNNLATDSEKSEQQGMMYLYAGAMLTFRNPRAHALIEDDPEMALEIVGFISHLAKALDRTKR
jgi:uncharacterized protein (TIGR02391 family)